MDGERTARQDGGPGTVEVKTTVVRELARFGQNIAVRTNVQSHLDMLDRAGLGVTDTFFKRVPGIVGKVIMWGGARRRLGGIPVGFYQPLDEGSGFRRDE